MIQRLRKGEHGQALVEMALVLPLFFLLLFGVIEMGRVGYAYITVSNAARAGGRTATIGGTDADINNSVQYAATSLDSASLTIAITPTQSQRKSGQQVTVKVNYPVQLIIPIISNVIPNPVVVSSSIIMRLE
ncbi:TadE/TadG family type IV pilus assembly protein [Desulfosporosinus sp. Sb-LF]|uniref:TadE family protein n=1 Tax=Desulfosporosinus sp. Sb-LF TaxID=2560027 RepID=UPI00107F5554|nr:TadE/TadG family type IV pilus assembly protein [Desulfosporosinus sp. Sb-LF]TGE32429.1 pilus assembly protein [Desulfosporosinus sp. Sb-LF]